MKVVLTLVLAIVLTLGAASPRVYAQTPCRFVLGFADMVDYVGAAEVGPCLENQRTITGVERFAVEGFSSVEVNAGASVQWTSRGLLVWYPSDNSTKFYSRRGIWFRSASGSNFVSMAELTAPSSTTPVALPPTPRPIAPRSVGLTFADLDGASYLVADDGTYLGAISSNEYDSKSICNKYGDYGSVYSSASIKNKYSDYGSPYSDLSPYNKYTTTPPSIVYQRRIVGSLSKNSYAPGSVDPDRLLLFLGCPKE